MTTEQQALAAALAGGELGPGQPSERERRLEAALLSFSAPEWVIELMRHKTETEHDSESVLSWSVSVPGSDTRWDWAVSVQDFLTARQALGDTHD